MRRSKIKIIFLLMITIVGCSTTRIDEEVNTAFTITDDESIGVDTPDQAATVERQILAES